MSAPPLHNLKLQELLEHQGVRVLFAATKTFCVYFKSPEGANGPPEITVTPFMVKRGLDPIRYAWDEVTTIEPKQGLSLVMDMSLPHRIDEDTVQSIELSELDSERAALKGRLRFASHGRRGAERFIVEAQNPKTGKWLPNFVAPGKATMVAKITYQIVPDRWRVREEEDV